jgi:hypothetical protein
VTQRCELMDQYNIPTTHFCPSVRSHFPIPLFSLFCPFSSLRVELFDIWLEYNLSLDTFLDLKYDTVVILIWRSVGFELTCTRPKLPNSVLE